MKLFKNILKVIIVYAICMVFIYSLVIRVKQIDERDNKLVKETNIEEYYVYDYE